MKKSLSGVILLGLLSSSVFAEMPSAKQMRQVTDKSTKEAYNKLLSSKAGKEVYSGIMKILEDNVSRIANKGFYDTFTITIYNGSKIGHEKLLKKLSKQDQAIMRQKIINDLKDKGYKITLNQYWDNPDNMNISITW